MPAESRAQQRFMGWIKANPKEGKKRGISTKVADEFARAPGGSTQDLPERKRKKSPLHDHDRSP